MADVVARTFEVGQNSGGVAALQTWIAAQVSGSLATNLILTVNYEDFEQDYILAVMATSLAKSGSNPVGSFVAAKSFNIRNDGAAALATWLNGLQAGTTTPSVASLSSIAGGTLTSQGTMAVRVTLVTPAGESAASTEATLAVADNHELVVASPTDASGLATGWNVYVGGTGAEHKQNSSPLTLGASYTQTVAVTTSGGAAPSSNSSGIKYVHSATLSERKHQRIVTVVVSN